MNKYEAMYKKATENGRSASWFDTSVVPLAQDLEEATGMTAKVSGAFGLRCECHIVLEKDDRKKTIVVTPDIKDDGSLELYYDTGEIRDRFRSDSIGALNGFNNITERLPDTLYGIIRVMREERG